MRVLALVASVAFLSMLPASARADEVDACANAYEAAQRLHQKNDPKAISEATTCARDVCPEVLRKECSVWVKEWTSNDKTASKTEKSDVAPSSSAASSSSPPSSDTAERPVPILAYVLGGGGLVALGVASGFAIHGMSIRNDLQRSACEPNCASDRVDSARTAFVVADVFGIAGLAALGGALAVYLTRPEVRGTDAKSSARMRIELAPLAFGAAVRGTF